MSLFEYALESECYLYSVDPEIVNYFCLTSFDEVILNEENDATLYYMMDFIDPDYPNVDSKAAFFDKDGDIVGFELIGVSWPSLFYTVLTSWDNASSKTRIKMDQLKSKFLNLNRLQGEEDMVRLKEEIKTIETLSTLIEKDYNDFWLDIPNVILPLQQFRNTASKWTTAQKLEHPAMTECEKCISFAVETKRVDLMADYKKTFCDMEVLKKRKAELTKKEQFKILQTYGIEFFTQVLKLTWPVLHGNYTIGPISSVWYHILLK